MGKLTELPFTLRRLFLPEALCWLPGFFFFPVWQAWESCKHSQQPPQATEQGEIAAEHPLPLHEPELFTEPSF